MQKLHRRLTEWESKGALASTDRDPRGDNEKKCITELAYTQLRISPIHETGRVSLLNIINYCFIYLSYQPKPGFSSPAFSWRMNSSPSYNIKPPDIQCKAISREGAWLLQSLQKQRTYCQTRNTALAAAVAVWGRMKSISCRLQIYTFKLILYTWFEAG